MTQRVLYVLAVPDDAQMSRKQQARRDIQQHGIVEEGQPNVENVSSQPKGKTLRGAYRGKYAEEMAREFKELFSASAIKSVVYYGTDADGNRVETNEDGYYDLQDVNIGPADPRGEAGVHQWDGKLIKKGTKKTHWRAVKTNPTDITSSNPYSSAVTENIYIPTNATKARWYNPADGTIESATAGSDTSGEFEDMTPYDISEPSFSGSKPALIYTVPYEREGRGDSKVWDQYGRTKDDTTRVATDTLVGDANVNSSGSSGVSNTWPRVFDAEHDFNGVAVVENGVLRLRFDESGNSLTAYNWSSGSYSKTSLGSSDWQLFDLDLKRIGDDRVNAQVIFENTSNSNLYHIDMSLKRGYADALWTEPPNEGSIPSGLKTKLDPIASDIQKDPLAEKTLVSRQEVRR